LRAERSVRRGSRAGGGTCWPSTHVEGVPTGATRGKARGKAHC
jgi:hypothetical protein